MSDLHMLWFTIPDNELRVSRQEMSDLVAGYGWPKGSMVRDSKVAAFLKACRVTVEYQDAGGLPQVIRAVETKRSVEFITFTVVGSPDGHRVAEYKFFQSRRSREGVVKGTHLVRSTLRKGMNDEEKAATRAWIEQADAVYATAQDEPVIWDLRRQVAVTTLSVCIPMRESTFFVYDDDISVVHDVRDFLVKTIAMTTGFNLVAIDDDSDYAPFAASADAHLCGRLEAYLARMRAALDPDANRVSVDRRARWLEVIAGLRVEQARHERRLRIGLPQIGSALLEADQLVSDLTRLASLPRVRHR